MQANNNSDNSAEATAPNANTPVNSIPGNPGQDNPAPKSDVVSNPDWAQLQKLCPKLHSHMHIYPQEFRGETWYILHDKSSGRHLRFNSTAYQFIHRLDGEYSIGEIYEHLQQHSGHATPGADEISLIISQLFSIEALKSASSNTEQMFNRYERNRRQKRQRALVNPLAIRAPLFDPDKLLNRFIPFIRPCFTAAGAFIWMLVVGYACLLALGNIPELSAALNSDIFAPSNLVTMAILFVFIKAIHEMAHAFAVKVWGGEVHEMGITLLVLMPIPYVDASASASFRDKRKRMLVGAAGILVELFIAALALLLWLSVEPGLLRDVALNTVLIASVSTLLFNANPLLRFDGYYVLQDFIEIPNLYTRASRYYMYLLKHYGFGVKSARSPVTAAGERAWFASYGLAAFIYRFIILFVIVMFLAEEYLVLGVALGCWAVIMQVLLPLFKGLQYLRTSDELGEHRGRAIRFTGGGVTAIVTLLLLLPAPLTTQSEGVLWVADQAQLYCKTNGFMAELLVVPGQTVKIGTPVARLNNPTLNSELAVTRAKRNELATEAASERRQNWIKSQIIEHQLDTIKAELKLLEKKHSQLLVRSQAEGSFVPANRNTLLGRYFKQGELFGYVVSPENLIVKAVVSQSSVGLLARGDSRARVRFAERVNQPVDAIIDRHTPSGKTRLPSAALGAAGGGSIAVTNADSSGTTAAEKVFEVELRLPADLPHLAGIGERAYVRFYHGHEPLALQWWRNGRQLFLSRLDV